MRVAESTVIFFPIALHRCSGQAVLSGKSIMICRIWLSFEAHHVLAIIPLANPCSSCANERLICTSTQQMDAKLSMHEMTCPIWWRRRGGASARNNSELEHSLLWMLSDMTV